jgi:hypothetical protein
MAWQEAWAGASQMIKQMNTLHRIAGSPWTVMIGTLASVGGLAWVIFASVAGSPLFWPVLLMVVAFAFLFSVGAYSVRVRNENASLKSLAGHIHRVNHIYRDVLHACFDAASPVTNRNELLLQERGTIRSVCQRIQSMFSRLICRDCLVTVKLMTRDGNGNEYCTTYERSQDKCERDRDGIKAFEVGTGRNTAFDEALRMRHDGQCSHFFCSDLTRRRGDYSNQRQHWDQFYRATIVVPIRNPRSLQDIDDSDDLGFLCVDTMSRNRLDDGYHVELLAAFADQMYNFFSLMRGSYNALADERSETLPQPSSVKG